MQYLLDTVTLIRHFSSHGKLGKKASEILDNIESGHDIFFISVISLMEVMYLAEKNRIEIGLQETLAMINSSMNFTIVDLNPEILMVADTLKFPDLHDRLILATAKWLGIPIISSDRKFRHGEGLQVVGN